MHASAYELGRTFFALYWRETFGRILDVGARDVNGTLRDFCPPNADYTGVDLEPGPGVDRVLDEPTKFPFADDTFDVVVSTSSFEHDQMFWLTFAEMGRVLRLGGYIYINAPSNGIYHAYPYDNWRFYPDSGRALEAWSEKLNLKLRLVESFIAGRKSDRWNDFVAVFTKGDGPAGTQGYLVDSYAKTYNGRKTSYGSLENFSANPEDILLHQELQRKYARLEKQLAAKHVKIDTLTQNLSAAKFELAKVKAGHAEVKAKLAAVKAELADVYRSRSWRLTAPLRAANARLRRQLNAKKPPRK